MARSEGFYRRMRMSKQILNRPIRPSDEPVPPVVPPTPRVIHDDPMAIEPRDARAVRVMRAEYPEGRPFEWRWVLIAEAASMSQAIHVASAQKYKARALPLNGQHFDNAKPMKVTAPVRHIIGDDDRILCEVGRQIVTEYDIEIGDLCRVVHGSWKPELCPACVAAAPAERF